MPDTGSLDVCSPPESMLSSEFSISLWAMIGPTALYREDFTAVMHYFMCSIAYLIADSAEAPMLASVESLSDLPVSEHSATKFLPLSLLKHN